MARTEARPALLADTHRSQAFPHAIPRVAVPAKGELWAARHSTGRILR